MKYLCKEGHLHNSPEKATSWNCRFCRAAVRKAKLREAKLTEKDFDLLDSLWDGADVWAFGSAMRLREIQRHLPKLIKIVKAKNAPEDGSMRRPYFGAKLMETGKKVVREHYKRSKQRTA